jgi:hypothetical protein
VTLTKKGSRPIVVDGHRLRFSVFRKGIRGCPDCDALHVVISDDSRRGSVLQGRLADPTGPDVAITPRMIATAAAGALAAGWRPGEGRGVFLSVPL